jgi:hypothetical protein
VSLSGALYDLRFDNPVHAQRIDTRAEQTFFIERSPNPKSMSLQFSFDEEAHLWSFMVFPERVV